MMMGGSRRQRKRASYAKQERSGHSAVRRVRSAPEVGGAGDEPASLPGLRRGGEDRERDGRSHGETKMSGRQGQQTALPTLHKDEAPQQQSLSLSSMRRKLDKRQKSKQLSVLARMKGLGASKRHGGLSATLAGKLVRKSSHARMRLHRSM